jgi:uncharacterized membrane protein YciS (DUF1049 family)
MTEVLEIMGDVLCVLLILLFYLKSKTAEKRLKQAEKRAEYWMRCAISTTATTAKNTSAAIFEVE